jgi:hypothetical protein
VDGLLTSFASTYFAPYLALDVAVTTLLRKSRR